MLYQGQSITQSSFICPNLFIGALPPPGRKLQNAGIECVLFCASEYQPPKSIYKNVKCFYFPLDDSVLTQGIMQNAGAGAKKLRACLDGNVPTLVTCQMGINRSAFVAALALMLPARGKTATPSCLTGQQAISLIREKRSPSCLTNPHFFSKLLELRSLCASERYPFTY
jgi:hypothetical protein